MYKGMVDCFVRTVREEGVSALFKVRTGMLCTGAAAARGRGRYGQRQCLQAPFCAATGRARFKAWHIGALCGQDGGSMLHWVGKARATL